MRVRIIDNPWSYRGPYPVDRVLPVFRRAGWTVDVVHRERGRSARRQVEDALEDGCELIIGAGGDGTLRDIATVIAGSDVALGALPGGTANLWTHELGISMRPELAAQAVVDSRVRRMDMGRLAHPDGRFVRFLLIAGIGIDGLMLHRTDARLKGLLGPGGIALGALRAIPEYRPHAVRISADGRDAWEGSIVQVVVGNSRRYANVVDAAPGAVVDDGLLDVTIVASRGLRAMGRLGWELALARRPGGEVPQFRAREIGLSAPVTPPMEVDGNPIDPRSLREADHRPFRLTVEPRVLRVRVPVAYRGPLFAAPTPPPSGAPATPGEAPRAS